LFCDHKPVVQFLLKRTPSITTPRILRGLLILGSYAMTPQYRPGRVNCDADCLSRLPAGGNESDSSFLPGISLVLWLGARDDPMVAALAAPSDLPFDAATVARLTPTDAELGPVLSWTLQGWPREDPGGIHSHYFCRKEAITTMSGCLLWGERVILPQAMRKEALSLLHQSHAGVSRTRALATLYVWYPGISKEIELIVQQCAVCQELRPCSLDSPPRSWPSQRVWGRLHVDFASFEGKDLAVLVDATSGWVDAAWVTGPTALAAISLLRASCSVFGLPDAVVTDNGPAFRWAEWKAYLQTLGLDPLYSPPYAPFANGIVERQIRSLKELLAKWSTGSRERRLANVLFALRSTPCADGSSPAYWLAAAYAAFTGRARSPRSCGPPASQVSSWFLDILPNLPQAFTWSSVGPWGGSAGSGRGCA